MAWLSQNGPWLAIIFGLIGWLAYKTGLDGVYRAGLVALGLGFVIFIHELGHFATAKWCDVHVTTFSIGFGPALPGCSWQKGETTYKIAMLPLGGYVQMVGEGAENEENEDDPRSFKNKSVGQRMLIISAGVIMNVILGAICFIVVYQMHGVPRTPAAVERIDAGSPAWKMGVRSDSIITRLGKINNPSFGDLKLEVALSSAGDRLPFTFVRRVGDEDVKISLELEPYKDRNNKMPAIGVQPPAGVTLIKKYPGELRGQPAAVGSAAAAARKIDLKPGDIVLKATDPDDTKRELTPLPTGPGENLAELCSRMRKLVGKPMTLIVRHGGDAETETEVSLPPVGFEFQDAVVGTTDPATPAVVSASLVGSAVGTPFLSAGLVACRTMSPDDTLNVTPLEPAPPQLVGDSAHEDRDPFDFRRRMRALAGKPVVLQVKRAGVADPINILVPPAYHRTPGLRMQMGKVAAIRNDSPATGKIRPGDVLSGVKLVYDRETAINIDFDPVRLPFLMSQQIAKANKPDPRKWKAELTVLRPPSDPNDKRALVPETFTVEWQNEWSSNEEMPVTAASPMSIPELGIAYRVESTVEEVTRKDLDKLQQGDVIVEIRFRKLTKNPDEESWTNWGEMQSDRAGEKVSDQWAHWFFMWLQGLEQHQEFEVKVRRGQAQLPAPVRIQLREDENWPIADRGLLFRPVMKLERSTSLTNALALGWRDTVSSIKQIYLTLGSLIRGDVSADMIGGPIEIASQSFAAAEDPWTLILFLGMISVNLAVVNFLPIPLLDGGHMVFLIYEKLRGKPPSEGVRAGATYLGLAILLGLMIFVFANDIHRRWFAGP
jgi:membrane-associated protease RseP (regulator of RpoE activity)